MGLRRLSDPIPVIPTSGSISLSVARHLSPNYQSPETQQFHEQRSETVHSFVDESGVLVVDWGATDTDPPREIVDLILQIAPELIEASATILAAWIATRDTKSKKKQGEAPVLGFTLQTSAGDRLDFDYRNVKDFDHVMKSIKSFLKQ